jgi:hypothetical protein
MAWSSKQLRLAAAVHLLMKVMLAALSPRAGLPTCWLAQVACSRWPLSLRGLRVQRAQFGQGLVHLLAGAGACLTGTAANVASCGVCQPPLCTDLLVLSSTTCLVFWTSCRLLLLPPPLEHSMLLVGSAAWGVWVLACAQNVHNMGSCVHVQGQNRERGRVLPVQLHQHQGPVTCWYVCLLKTAVVCHIIACWCHWLLQPLTLVEWWTLSPSGS